MSLMTLTETSSGPAARSSFVDQNFTGMADAPLSTWEAHALLAAAGFELKDFRKASAVGGAVMTPLAWASKEGHVGLLDFLASNGLGPADTTIANNNGMTPLIRACMNGKLQAAVWLAQHGARADISRPSAFGWKAMHWACEGGHIAIVQWLMSMGASSDLHATSESGRSPLFLACLNGHLKLAKYLHILGGEEQDVRRSDNYGKTPMHVACEQGHLHVCQWLWGAGAADDISKVDVSGRTALELACEGGHLGVCEWLYSVQKINGRGRNEKQEGGGRGAAHGAFAI